MAIDREHAAAYLADLLRQHGMEQLRDRLTPRHHPPARNLPRRHEPLPRLVEERWTALQAADHVRARVADAQALADMRTYARNIENYIGTARVPVGVAGPLRVNGIHAADDFFVPLATTEAALVASYHRGSRLITESGGCAAMVLSEGVSRAPGFAFATLPEAGRFVAWALSQRCRFEEIVSGTTSHGRLDGMDVTVEGNHVYLIFKFHTGEAAGQNMVTFATAAIVEEILAHAPVHPTHHYVEANMSGDKKASAQSFMGVRGRKVTAEVRVPAALVRERLHTEPAEMEAYWRMSAVGGSLSGTIGFQGHYSNALAALYLACGQDVATVSESAVGITRMELQDGDLYAAVTLPNLIVGTVGGGTRLPTQAACLEILRLPTINGARALAEVCGAIALAGELSIIGALAAGHFARAHHRLSRAPIPDETDA